MRHRVRVSLAHLNERLANVNLNKKVAAGIGAAVLVTGAATGTAVALTGGDSGSTPTASAAATAAARPSADTANRSEQRTALQAQTQAAAAAKAKAAADAKAKADAAAKAKAEADAKAKADAAAKAKAQAQAQAQAAAAAKAKAAAAAAAATPVYSNDLSGWIAQARAILAAHGDHVPPADAIRARAMTESTGNPSAINNWDSNAAAGTPSKGLMQVIDPTFATYALPGHMNIWNPVDNIIAGVRYANATYGAFENVAYGSSGY